jgi:hypothetical protein
MSGWIKLHRKITDNPLYFSEPFTRSMAWVDMLLIANHTDNFFFKRGIRVDIKTGQIGYDLDTLSKRWKWSRGKVERFLQMLEKDEQIVRQKTNVTTLISIVNYKEYQTDDKANRKANDKPNSKPNEHKQECIRNIKNEKELILDRWIEYRKQIKKPIKEATQETILAKMENFTEEQCKFVIDNSIENGWQGLFWDKLPKKEELSEEQLTYNYVQKMLNFKDTKDYSNAD